MANKYWKGQAVRVIGSFTVNSVAINPTTVTLKIKDPSGTTDTYTYALGQVIKSVDGTFYRDVATDEEGTWQYRWEGTGTCEAVVENWFTVKSSF